MTERKYIAIDLKSFYASVECVERGLDALNTNLVVADESRTEKTICLAVSPSLKACGIPGRPRLFEVIQQVKRVNSGRLRHAPDGKFTGSSYLSDELKKNPGLELSYIIARPRMAYYIEYSTRIYQIYLKYVAPEDIHVYSIDEVFIDVTNYLAAYRMTARELASAMLQDVLRQTGITATAGIGTNLYLAKIAMDIVAKKMPADKSGARIAELDEMSYRRQLWNHTPLTDFWRVGAGYVKKLEKRCILTMGDIARCSLQNEDMLYDMFGVNAELLIDHAWGYEPCTIDIIRSYKPCAKSLSIGQVLQRPYKFDEARLVTLEMADSLATDLVSKRVLTDQIVLTVGYDAENRGYDREAHIDRYGRKVPVHAHGTQALPRKTSSSRLISAAVRELFERVVDKRLTVRRIYVVACNIVPESSTESEYRQLDFFTDTEETERENEALEREKNVQRAMIGIKEKYGKNALIKGINLQEGATGISRNKEIGGHRA